MKYSRNSCILIHKNAFENVCKMVWSASICLSSVHLPQYYLRQNRRYKQAPTIYTVIRKRRFGSQDEMITICGAKEMTTTSNRIGVGNSTGKLRVPTKQVHYMYIFYVTCTSVLLFLWDECLHEDLISWKTSIYLISCMANGNIKTLLTSLDMHIYAAKPSISLIAEKRPGDPFPYMG